MMKSYLFLLILLLYFSVGNSVKIGNWLSECFTIDTKCYQLVYLKLTHFPAHEVCEHAGGSLAIITEDYIWEKIIRNFLKNDTEINEVWLGPAVAVGHTSFEDDVNLEHVKYLTTPLHSLTRSSDRRALYASFKSNWYWELRESYKYSSPFLCEFSVPNVTNCDLPIIKNANWTNYNSSSVFPLGITLQVNCSKGFVLEGPKRITCQQGTWSSLPACEIRTCSQPKVIETATQISEIKENYLAGERVIFTCKHNYFSNKIGVYFNSLFSLECKYNQVWFGNIKKCSAAFQHFEDHLRPDKLTILYCDLDVKRLPISNVEIQWLKNGDYTDTSLSNSHLTDVTEEGFYICKVELNGQIRIGAYFYTVILEEKKCNTFKRFNHSLNRKSSVILQTYSTEYNEKGHWFSNSYAIWKTTVLPNGQLLLNDIQFEDTAIYTYRDINNYCQTEINHQVTVKEMMDIECGVELPFGIQFSWILFLKSNHSFRVNPCQAVILSKTWVLISASCFYPVPKGPVFQEHLETQSGDKVEISEIIIHPLYKPPLPSYNLALIKLKHPINNFSETQRSVCITNKNFINLNQSRLTNYNISGFLAEREEGIDSVLQYNKPIFVNPKTNCKIDDVIISNDMFCIAQSKVKRFKSESPFFLHRGNKVYVVGFFNWNWKHLSYYTNVAVHYDWIMQVINNKM